MADNDDNGATNLIRFIHSLAKDGMIDIRLAKEGDRNERKRDIDRDRDG